MPKLNYGVFKFAQMSCEPHHCFGVVFKNTFTIITPALQPTLLYETVIFS